MAFKDDVRIRSNIKKSAAYKKNGSATQKLGNRRMTWQEISEKHGPVSEWCLKDFVDYSAFVQMPHDIQIEYVNKLCDEYDVGLQHLSQFLFNKGGDGLRAYLRNNKILDKCNPQKSRGKTGLNRFKDDILDWKRRSAATEVPELPVEEETSKSLPMFISYEEFKRLPDDDIVNFLNTAIDYYSIGYTPIAKEVFKVSEGNVYGILKSRKLVDKIHRQEKAFFKTEQYRECHERFLNDVKEWRETMVKKEETVTVTGNTVPNELLNAIIGDTETVDIPKEPVVEIKEVIPEEPVHKTIEAVPVDEPEKNDSLLYHDSSFVSDYISVGLDHDELSGLELLFKNKKVRVSIKITELG